MKVLTLKRFVLLLSLLFLLSPLAAANSQGEEHNSDGVQLSVLSGFLVFLFLLSTVIVALLMKKGKASVKTHHTFAFITLALALFHGVYNFLTH